ncbi:MAG: hypothetical protein L3J09_11370 [Flavobacteriaceae bacterium]|nr:hypothetical protein [Flavobacteriaceae bacterium]
MKNLIKLTILLVAVLIVDSPKINAQNYYMARQITNTALSLDQFITRFDNGVDLNDVKSYKGTPYNTPNYLIGNIYENSTLLANDVALRYNAVSDEIEVKESITTPDEEAKVLTKSIDIYVKINGDIFIFAPYQGGVEGGGYFQVLFEGTQYSFYKKIIKKFTPAKKASTSITTDTPAMFQDKPVYYIVTKKGRYYEFPSSKSKKIKVFGEQKDAIKKYVKEKGLDLNKEKDLKKAVIYFDKIEGSKL